MTTLRESTKKKIADALEKSYFSAASFSTKFDEDKAEFVRIVFLPNRALHFAIEGDGPFATSEAPGLHIHSGEEFKRDSLDAAIRAISTWTGRILEDYRIQHPILDEFEQLRKSLNDKLREHLQDEDAHFSPEEAEALRTKLDELTAKFADIAEKSEAFERNLKEAKQEIQALKADLEFFPRGVWLRMAAGKVLNVIKKVVTSKEGRELALEAAKKLLLEGPKP